MKKIFMMMAVALLAISCGQSKKDNTTTDNTPTAQKNLMTTTAETVDPDNEAYIPSRVKSIYEDVFSEYNEASENESIPQHSPDEKYCSEDWNKTLLQVQEYDQQHNPDDIGFFEADYWVMGQDFTDLSVSDVNLVKHEGNNAEVKLNLHNSGSVIPIVVVMKYERGNWFIDDFIDIEHNYDWKADMKDYVKQ